MCNRALARALGAPQVPPVLQPVGLIPVTAAPPLHANLPDGETTAALYEFDQVTLRPGETPVRAEHGNVPASQEALRQTTRFIQSWLGSGVAEIVDPR